MSDKQKEKIDIQAELLRKLIIKQKEKLQDREFTTKILFLIMKYPYYNNLITEIEDIITVSETLLLCGQYRRSMHYICIAGQIIDNMQKQLENDFLKIKQLFEKTY
jgi:hypothetical protein